MKSFLATLSSSIDHIGANGQLPDTDVHFNEDRLYVEDDMGSRTEIGTVYSETLLGIRRAVRELNPGRIPIYSDYDCTGKLCFQGCKLIKVYKTYSEGYVAVVEIRKTFDV
jgi:hypothetical protein